MRLVETTPVIRFGAVFCSGRRETELMVTGETASGGLRSVRFDPGTAKSASVFDDYVRVISVMSHREYANYGKTGMELAINLGQELDK